MVPGCHRLIGFWLTVGKPPRGRRGEDERERWAIIDSGGKWDDFLDGGILNETAEPIRVARVEFAGDTPRSLEFDDNYFMAGRGVEESQAVFVEANHLPERFGALRSGELFVLGETGFGTGLNVLLAAECFSRCAPTGARLQILSAEKFPLTISDLKQALSHWPSHAEWARRLIDDYPAPVPGYHRVRLAETIDLILMYGDAAESWCQSRAMIDAWFLDGFAPARNREMWSPELFRALAERSRPGATLATFTAASDVRRGLAEAGFDVVKVAGFGNKRHRLTGRFPGTWTARSLRTGRVIVAGAGLAGASAARELAELGWQVTVMDRAGPASGASGNLAGVVYSTPSAHLTPQNRFYQSSLIRALSWMQRLNFPATCEDGRLNNVILAPTDQRLLKKLTRALDSGAWPAELLSLGDDGTFCLHGAGYLRPAAWCRRLLDHPRIECRPHEIQSFAPDARVRTVDGQTLGADAVVLCLAEHTARLPGLEWLHIKRIRGQVSYCAATAESRGWDQAICHAGYLTPALDDRHCVGATFDLRRVDPDVDPSDDLANLDQLKSEVPERWRELGGDAINVVDRRAAIRCQSPDFLPQVGPLPNPHDNPHTSIPGVYLNIAHGSRGLTHTPLCAEKLAADLTGVVHPTEPAIADALTPERFILRHRRRNPEWQPANRLI